MLNPSERFGRWYRVATSLLGVDLPDAGGTRGATLGEHSRLYRQPAATVKFLSHPAFLAFLILVFVTVGLAVARWRYVRKQRSASDTLPSIPASEIAHPGSGPAPAPATVSKDTPQEVVERALRRGDKALENLQGPSLPFLDTAPLAHQEPEQAEINTADGKQTSRQ